MPGARCGRRWNCARLRVFLTLAEELQRQALPAVTASAGPVIHVSSSAVALERVERPRRARVGHKPRHQRAQTRPKRRRPGTDPACQHEQERQWHAGRQDREDAEQPPRTSWRSPATRRSGRGGRRYGLAAALLFGRAQPCMIFACLGYSPASSALTEAVVVTVTPACSSRRSEMSCPSAVAEPQASATKATW
jgi:hypothetical protein